MPSIKINGVWITTSPTTKISEAEREPEPREPEPEPSDRLEYHGVIEEEDPASDHWRFPVEGFLMCADPELREDYYAQKT